MTFLTKNACQPSLLYYTCIKMHGNIHWLNDDWFAIHRAELVNRYAFCIASHYKAFHETNWFISIWIFQLISQNSLELVWKYLDLERDIRIHSTMALEWFWALKSSFDIYIIMNSTETFRSEPCTKSFARLTPTKSLYSKMYILYVHCCIYFAYFLLISIWKFSPLKKCMLISNSINEIQMRITLAFWLFTCQWHYCVTANTHTQSQKWKKGEAKRKWMNANACWHKLSTFFLHMEFNQAYHIYPSWILNINDSFIKRDPQITRWVHRLWDVCVCVCDWLLIFFLFIQPAKSQVQIHFCNMLIPYWRSCAEAPIYRVYILC